MKKHKKEKVKEEYYNIRLVYIDNDMKTYVACTNFFIHFTARYIGFEISGYKYVLPLDNLKVFSIERYYTEDENE